MANTVLTLPSEKIKQVTTHYKHGEISPTAPGAVFMAKLPGCTITVYKSKKVMFQGANHEMEASKWGTAQPSVKKATKSTNTLPANFASLSVIGSDEVGKGDFFGPMTVVASYVSKEHMSLVKELGVQDSKNLTDPQIVKIAEDLLTFLPYSLLTLSNEKYNELQAKGYTQGKMTALLHNKAILHVLNKIAPEKPDAILIDQFAQKDIYYRHLRGQREIVRDQVHFATKAEGLHLSVAASSILARYAFLKAFEHLSKQAGFNIPKGAGAKVDIAAAKLIRTHGVDALNSFTKVHFANTQKAKKIAFKN